MVTLKEAKKIVTQGMYAKQADLLIVENSTIQQVKSAYNTARKEVAKDLKKSWDKYNAGKKVLTPAQLKLAGTKVLRDQQLFDSLESRLTQLGGSLDKINGKAILEAAGISDSFTQKEFEAMCKFTNLDPSSFALINQFQAEVAIGKVNKGTKFINKVIQKDTLKAMRQQMRIGLLTGDSIEQITQRLVSKTALTLEGVNKGVFSSIEQRARLNARWGVIESANNAAETQYGSFNQRVNNAGMKDMQLMKQVIAEIDDRTTETCIYANGQIRKINEDFETAEGSLPYPPFHPNCRTTIGSWHQAFEAYGKNTKDMLEQSKKELKKRGKTTAKKKAGKKFTKKQLAKQKATQKAGAKALKATNATNPGTVQTMTEALTKKAEGLHPEQMTEVLNAKTNKARSSLIDKYQKANMKKPNYEMTDKEFYEHWVKDKEFKKIMNPPDQFEMPQWDSGDEQLKALWKKAGFDKKPKIVNKATFDEMVAQNEGKCMYRGMNMNGKEYATQFMTGEHYPGLGVYGNGTYTAYGEEHALSVAGRYGNMNVIKGKVAGPIIKKDLGENVVMRLMVSEDANIVPLQSLNAQRHNLLKEIGDSIDKRGIKALNTHDKAAFDALQIEKKIYRDFQNVIFDDGRFATMKGYDAIAPHGEALLSNADDGAYYVIQNRAQVIVCEDLITLENWETAYATVVK